MVILISPPERVLEQEGCARYFWAVRKRRSERAPKGLEVQLVDDDLAIFAWDAERPATPDLTPAERDVLTRITRGASNAAIATARKTSERTVANQVARLLKKLDASSRYDLIRRYARGE